MQKYKKLLVNIFIFGMGGFGQKLLSFLLIPVYTSYLSTEKFGAVDLLINIVQLFYPILNLSIHEAVLSFALDRKNDAKMVCTVAARYNVCSVGMFVCGTLLLRYFNIIQIGNSYVEFVCALYVVNLCNLYFSILAKVYNRLGLLAIAGLCNTLLYLGLSILFLKYLHWGIDGYMFAYIAGMLLSVVILAIGLADRKPLGKGYNRILAAQMRKFSCPLILNQSAWWMNNVSDRYMLAGALGTQMNGIYSMAYKIPNIISTFQNFVLQAWTISAIEEHGDVEANNYYSKVFSIYCFLLCSIASILMILNNAISKVLFQNDFYEAKQYVPILLLAVIYSSYSYFLGAILVAEKDSLIIAKSTIVGAVINVILNGTLIPFFLIYGAVMATVISNFIIMVYRFLVIFNRKKLKVNIFNQILLNALLITQINLCNQDRYFFHICIFAIIMVTNHKLLYELYKKGKESIWKILNEK